MNQVFKSLLLFCCVCLVTPFLLCGCSTEIKAPPTTTIVNSRLTILPCANDDEGEVHFENVTITTGILDRDYTNPWYGSFKKGDPCYLISGQIKSNAPIYHLITHFAYGYDSAGNITSFTLDDGPLSGIAWIGVAAGATESFLLHMSWSDNVSHFELHSQKAPFEIPGTTVTH
jgi:hypothetical protein